MCFCLLQYLLLLHTNTLEYPLHLIFKVAADFYKTVIVHQNNLFISPLDCIISLNTPFNKWRLHGASDGRTSNFLHLLGRGSVLACCDLGWSFYHLGEIDFRWSLGAHEGMVAPRVDFHMPIALRVPHDATLGWQGIRIFWKRNVERWVCVFVKREKERQ